MSQMRYPHLFEPITLGKQLFLNRLFAAPTGYRNMTYDSIYPEEALQYYRRKAMGGCASASTIPPAGSPWGSWPLPSPAMGPYPRRS